MDDKISAVVGKLQQRLGDYYEVRIVDVTKNNDTVKKGISVRKNGEKIGRIYYWNGEAAELNRKVFLEQKEDMEEILTRLKEYPATLRKVANIYREKEEKPKAVPWSSNLID